MPVPTPTPDQRYGGLLTVRLPAKIGLLSPLSQEPAARQAASLLFSGLVRLDARLRPQPDLASGWEISPNELIWTFTLRPNLKWHDGTLLTADDVVYTYDTLRKLDQPSVAQADFQEFVDRVEKVNSLGIRITLRRRFAPLMADLAYPILPKHLLEGLSPQEIARRPITVGSGPFRLREQRPEAVLLEAHESYHYGRPFLDGVALVVAEDEGVAARALAAGDLLVGQLSWETAQGLLYHPSLRVVDYPELGFNYVAFNLRPGRLFSDHNLRLAWAYALDKESLVAQATNGRGIAVWSHIPAPSWAYDPQVPRLKQDLARARALLTQSGWRDADGDGVLEKEGQELRLELYVRSDDADRMKTAHLMAEALREVGFAVEVTPSDFSSTLAAKRQPPFNFEAMVMGWNLGEDPDDYHLFHSSQIPTRDSPSLYNFIGFRNAEFDRLSVEARATADLSRRRALYAQIQRLLAELQPYYSLWAERRAVVLNRRLRGPVEPASPRFMWNIEQWYLAQEERP